MQPTLTWVDLTASDRDKMRRVLDLFNEQGTLDEMGLGSLRDTVSDALFPGTSYIQTRLRYALFVPWLYQRLEDKRVSSADVERATRRWETELIRSLERNEDKEGIIGIVARGALARLPSTLYWSALTRWGVFRHPQSQGWYHARFASLADRRSGDGRADDPGVVWSREPNWHPRLPKPPTGFPWEASFALTCEEADFLRGRLEERCAGTLLAWLARNGSTAPADHVWDDPDAQRAPVSVRDTVELARRFSLHVAGMPQALADQVARSALLRRARRKPRPARAAKCRENPLGRGSRPQGHRGRPPRALHDGRRDALHAHQGAQRGPLRRQAPGLHDPAAPDHRRDRLSSDRPSGGHAFLPAHQPSLRTRADDPHQRLELRELGRRLRRLRVIASAILDRILHHATTISIRGDSYRLKDKLKSGVVKPTMAGT